MTNTEEALDVFQKLAQIVSNQGLEWLVDDVHRQISIGKESSKDIQVESTVQREDTNYSFKRKGPSAKFIVMQPYTAQEKLILLVEAIESASVGLSSGLINTYKIIGENLKSVNSLGFAPDTEGSELKYIGRDILGKDTDVLLLNELLKELKEAINAT